VYTLNKVDSDLILQRIASATDLVSYICRIEGKFTGLTFYQTLHYNKCNSDISFGFSTVAYNLTPLEGAKTMNPETVRKYDKRSKVEIADSAKSNAFFVRKSTPKIGG
jgi:hypothetical protein